MNKKIMTLMAAALLCASSLAMAASVADNMDTIAENYGKVLKADSTDVIKKGLQAMRVAALDAQKGIPTKLKNKAEDGPEVKDFRHGLDLLIGQIDGALALADQGKLDEAKKAAQDFKPTRDTYHKKYR
ncbi:cytochrome b562 [Yersinia enterocolitica]|uniref:Cytochrome n=1 Tax=Yersinia enterocolitica serotype O:8 / biotype 1B (strain NCTC 13174 / 8081) TaxID=393305 RepID=A1JRH0_YERE8|nr:cytochrome b562 [Yersinia enterocolitica]AJJ24683.1 soluble cytochrome b562 [Yersinia enterocolitica]CAL13812.1 putative cytochrome [Yersinia enterocolitica subsp. enterocolitica 8081]HDL7733112.1 cytochrome b562 [Yersinia enterocolitica]HDL8279692.1 cytochrome b562 [Yersinia enterocolitica]HDL8476337.1 cytochrome b562 [Yersinia enterocolitica]